MELLHTSCSPKVHIDVVVFLIFATALLFTFERPMYMFFEEDMTGTVCVNKTGDTTETVQIMIQGGKFTTDREAVTAEVTKCIDDPMVFGIFHYTYYIVLWVVAIILSTHGQFQCLASHLSLFYSFTARSWNAYRSDTYIWTY